MEAVRTALVVKSFEFAAAHVLPNHLGKCSILHGHNYKVEVGVRGAIDDDPSSPTFGMVVDFGDLKAAVHKNILDRLDHSYLNTSLPDEIKPPTAENLAWYIFSVLNREYAPISFVRVWETSTSYAEVTRDDFNAAQSPIDGAQ